jgi:hypothetical protein
MHLPEPLLQIFIEFQAIFSAPAPSYRKIVWLVCGALLAHGRRTVTVALKMLGLADEPHWSKLHSRLNRAKWSGLDASAALLRLLR